MHHSLQNSHVGPQQRSSSHLSARGNQHSFFFLLRQSWRRRKALQLLGTCLLGGLNSVSLMWMDKFPWLPHEPGRWNTMLSLAYIGWPIWWWIPFSRMAWHQLYPSKGWWLEHSPGKWGFWMSECLGTYWIQHSHLPSPARLKLLCERCRFPPSLLKDRKQVCIFWGTSSCQCALGIIL